MGDRMAKKQLPKYMDFPPGTTIKDIMAWIRDDNVRSKTDLRDWTGSPKFHLNVEPVNEATPNKEETPSS
jgi:hypothetical protein